MMIRAHFKHCAPSCSFRFRDPTVTQVEIIKTKVLILFSLTYLEANLVCESGISISCHYLLSK